MLMGKGQAIVSVWLSELRILRWKTPKVEGSKQQKNIVSLLFQKNKQNKTKQFLVKVASLFVQMENMKERSSSVYNVQGIWWGWSREAIVHTAHPPQKQRTPSLFDFLKIPGPEFWDTAGMERLGNFDSK